MVLELERNKQLDTGEVLSTPLPRRIELIVDEELEKAYPHGVRTAQLFAGILNGISDWTARYILEDKENSNPAERLIKGRTTINMTDLNELMGLLGKAPDVIDPELSDGTRRDKTIELLSQIDMEKSNEINTGENVTLNGLSHILLDSFEQRISENVIELGTGDEGVDHPHVASRNYMVDIGSKVALDVLLKKIKGIKHEMATEIMFGFVEQQRNARKIASGESRMSWDGLFMQTTDSVISFGKFLDNSIDYLNDILPMERVSPARLTLPLRELEGVLLEQDISLEIELPKKSNICFIYSDVWAGMFMGAIVQNTIKAYQSRGEDKEGLPRVLKVKIEEEEDIVNMKIGDYGKGYDENIVENGFCEGYSSWDGKLGGTGIGMDLHQKALRDYGGSLRAENVIDDEGRPMSRLTTSFPKIV